MEKRDKPPVDAELKRRIEELIAYKGGGHNPDLVEDVVENALKLLHDVEDRGDVRVIQTAIRELRYAFKLFAPYANTRKVTIFGSARTQPSRTGPTSPPPAAWRELAPRLDPDKLVFIDETDCPYRKSNPGILMMETAEDRAADNIPGPLGAARDRRILVQ